MIAWRGMRRPAKRAHVVVRLVRGALLDRMARHFTNSRASDRVRSIWSP